VAVEPSVRRILATDRESLLEMDAVARSSLVDRRGGEAWLAEHRALDVDWPSDDGAPLGWVGLIDRAVVGFLTLLIEVRDGRGRVATIDRVYVEEAARELGFGDALLDAAETEARSQNCVALEGTALPGDRDTKNLFERGGVVARSITVSKTL